jgi:phage I-like protein
MATAKKSAPKPVKDLYSYCYTVRQASQLLNLSPKRVRQMITEGKLTKVNESPVLVEMRQVLALRDQREADPRYRKQPPPDQVTQLLDNFQKIIASVEEMNQKALTMRDEAQARNEENYLNQINQLKADLEAERARRWFKKR